MAAIRKCRPYRLELPITAKKELSGLRWVPRTKADDQGRHHRRRSPLAGFLSRHDPVPARRREVLPHRPFTRSPRRASPADGRRENPLPSSGNGFDLQRERAQHEAQNHHRPEHRPWTQSDVEPWTNGATRIIAGKASGQPREPPPGRFRHSRDRADPQQTEEQRPKADIGGARQPKCAGDRQYQPPEQRPSAMADGLANGAAQRAAPRSPPALTDGREPVGPAGQPGNPCGRASRQPAREPQAIPECDSDDQQIRPPAQPSKDESPRGDLAAFDFEKCHPNEQRPPPPERGNGPSGRIVHKKAAKQVEVHGIRSLQLGQPQVPKWRARLSA